MAVHHIHHTNAIILGSRNVGEANKVFTLYTRELGLVRASAQGVRRAQSKLRYALQDLSHVSVDLVHGREVWRVTSASFINSFPIARANRKSILLLARVARLVERLCAGEEGNKELFDDLVQSFTILDTDSVSDESRDALELYLVLRILNNLGYIGDNENLSKYLSSEFEPQIYTDLLSHKKPIVLAINQALRESGL